MSSCSLITFHRATYDDGFGFVCMQVAYKMGIRGRMDYSTRQGIVILAAGEEDCLKEFITWLNQSAGSISNINHQHLNYLPSNYKEFDIFRHST